MTNTIVNPKCLDKCGNDLITDHEVVCGICHSCLEGTSSSEAWVIWADGIMATLEELERGDYHYMSDDYRPATEEEVDAYYYSFNDEPTVEE